jgi:uncharacterized membrane protein
MALLIVGLVLFLGVHSVRVFGDGWRDRTVARTGEGAYKGLYSVISLVGLVLIVWGYGEARLTPTVVWSPPVGMRHLASLLTLIAFVLLAAAYVPGNRLRARLGHPMTLAVKVWALAHLLANGTVADILLFGGFLVWAVLVFRAARRRPGTVPAGKGSLGADAATVVVGLVLWAAFAFWLHGWLFGVRPMG